MFLLLYCIFTLWTTLINVKAECPTIISKNEWDGITPQYSQYLNIPLDLIVIQHTVTQSCSNDKSCAEIVRHIQKIHMEQAFLWDIGPSFLIGNNGKIYEGRGWNRVPVHTFGYNNQSFGIAFIGTFNNQEPSTQALQAARALIQCGVDKERLSTTYDVVVQSQLILTESPGKKLSSIVMTWPDWTPDVTAIKKGVEYRNETICTTIPISSGYRSVEPELQALASPKQIDLLSNFRDVIKELINNIRDLALQTLKTVKSLSEGLNSQAPLVIDKLMFGLNEHTKDIARDVSKILPFSGKLNTVIDNTEAMIRACADQKVKEIEDLLKNLGKLSSEAINFANTATEDTKNCTELNFGIQENTEACLKCVARDTRRLASIQTSLNNLAVTLEHCSQKHSVIASFLPDLPISRLTPKICVGGIFGC